MSKGTPLHPGIDHPERVMILAAALRTEVSRGLADDLLWQEALAAIRQSVPEIVELRFGVCAMRARGPSRYYGSESAAAQQVLQSAAIDATVGVGSGRFAAEQAALTHEASPDLHIPSPHVRIVSADRTAPFLAPLPIECAADEEFAELLTSLGVRTLGAFAALPEAAVLQRFGPAALVTHWRSRGLGEFRASEMPSNRPTPDLRSELTFEYPVEKEEQLAFACRSPAERFVRTLSEQSLVCTELLIELTDDAGCTQERRWSHPANFTATDVINRVRWQAGDLLHTAARNRTGFVKVRFTPVHTAQASAHEPGLWSTAPDKRVHHQLTRVQSLIGHEKVGTGVLLGGRFSTDRQMLLPWGVAAPRTSDTSAQVRPPHGPWPGHLTGALPNTVFTVPPQLSLLNHSGAELCIDDDDLLSDAPAALVIDAQPPRTVRAWSAPWPLREHWWAHSPPGDHSRVIFRLQVLLESGEAWLLGFDPARGWFAEGRYT